MTITADTAFSLSECAKKLGVAEDSLANHVKQHSTALRLDPDKNLRIKPGQLFDLKLLLILSKKSYSAEQIEAVLSFVQTLSVWKQIKSSNTKTFNRPLWISLLATIDLFVRAIRETELTELVLDPDQGIELRSDGTLLTEQNAKAALQRLDFFDAQHHSHGKGFEHFYRAYRSDNDHYIVDYKTRLMWQRGGSAWLIYPQVQAYIDELNRNQFAGFFDWRLPTLEEAMSLMEPKPQHQNLHIDPVFEDQQRIWSSDWQQHNSLAWMANFGHGESEAAYIWVNDACVRAVRCWR